MNPMTSGIMIGIQPFGPQFPRAIDQLIIMLHRQQRHLALVERNTRHKGGVLAQYVECNLYVFDSRARTTA